MDCIEIRRPDDFHVHVRQGTISKGFIKLTAKQFARATIMPNTSPPIRTIDEGIRYKHFLEDGLTVDFKPLMTLYLTDETDVLDIEFAANSDDFIGAKLYPSGATTNSDAGVSNIAVDAPIFKVFKAMETFGLPLLVHAEMAEGDIFEREKDFLTRKMYLILKYFPKMKVVIEHITTAFAVNWVEEKVKEGFDAAATITAHHLLADRNDMLADGLKPHYYCKPILKRQMDKEVLLTAATHGAPYFFAGTDSAPHSISSKENHCCAAGCFTANNAVELYLTAFERRGKLDNFESFMSENGANFFGLPLNTGTIRIHRQKRTIEDLFYIEVDILRNFMAGEEIGWKVVD